jgi:predicted ATPase
VERPDRCIGRDQQVDDLVGALTGPVPVICVVLGGPGIGKTTLTRAVGTAGTVVERYGTRRWFAPLDTAQDAAALETAIIEAVGLNPADARFDDALAKLGEQQCLLILDNLETPWEAESQAVEATLRRITSVPGVALVASVRGQAAPRAPRWTSRVDVRPLNDAAARDLFRDIAPNIAVDDPHLSDFLRALGGIPLAIELVAYRAASYGTLGELWGEWQRLGDECAVRLGVDPSRLTSLPHSIELSQQSRRLTASGKRLFRLLGQLPGGIAAEDRAALLADAAARSAEEVSAVGLAIRHGDRLDLLPPIREHARRFHAPRTLTRNAGAIIT